MEKQDEIREGMKTVLEEYNNCGYMNLDCTCPECLDDRDKVVTALLKFLHSEGGVIKVEEKPAEVNLSGALSEIKTAYYRYGQRSISFLPLIKEG